jgi:hypothetical protein
MMDIDHILHDVLSIGDEDSCRNASLVSKTWRSICMKESEAFHTIRNVHDTAVNNELFSLIKNVTHEGVHVIIKQITLHNTRNLYLFSKLLHDPLVSVYVIHFEC